MSKKTVKVCDICGKELEEDEKFYNNGWEHGLLKELIEGLNGGIQKSASVDSDKDVSYQYLLGSRRPRFDLCGDCRDVIHGKILRNDEGIKSAFLEMWSNKDKEVAVCPICGKVYNNEHMDNHKRLSGHMRSHNGD